MRRKVQHNGETRILNISRYVDWKPVNFGITVPVLRNWIVSYFFWKNADNLSFFKIFIRFLSYKDGLRWIIRIPEIFFWDFFHFQAQRFHILFSSKRLGWQLSEFRNIPVVRLSFSDLNDQPSPLQLYDTTTSCKIGLQLLQNQRGKSSGTKRKILNEPKPKRASKRARERV